MPKQLLHSHPLHSSQRNVRIHKGKQNEFPQKAGISSQISQKSGRNLYQQATKHATGTANGIVGIFGYASSVVTGVMFGAQAEAGGWDSVFPIAIAFGVVGAIAIGLMWNAPADGYEKLNKVMNEE